MRSIVFLDFGRKEKHHTGGRAQGGVSLGILLALLFCITGPFCGTAAAGDVVLQTPNSGAVITKDPETGDRIMRTPEPREEETYQGPDTIIVSPEIYPPVSGGNTRPPTKPRPPKPRPR